MMVVVVVTVDFGIFWFGGGGLVEMVVLILSTGISGPNGGSGSGDRVALGYGCVKRDYE